MAKSKPKKKLKPDAKAPKQKQKPTAKVDEPKPDAAAAKAASRKATWSVVKWIAGIALLASLLLNLSTYLLPVVRHYGNSMSPTLEENQLLLMLKSDNVDPGDIIAFYYNNNVMVRRVIAGPGDTVNIDIFGAVSVNGEPIKEDYVATPAMGQTDIQYPYTVPANSYFVMGDDREIAMDSRLTEIGPIPRDRIVGRLIFSLSPFGTV